MSRKRIDQLAMMRRGGQMGYEDEKDAVLIRRPGDYTYFDISIPHNDFIQSNGSPTPAKFLQTRGSPLFDGKPSDYNLSVVRFTAPTMMIPIQIFPIQAAPNIDINLSIYSITLRWGAFVHQVYLVWDTEDLTAPVPANTSVNIVNNNFWQYYALYSYEHFARMINVALAAATVLIVADGHAATGPPFITYDAPTNLFTLNAPAAFLNTAAVPIEIYMNTALYGNFLNSMDATRYSYIDPLNANLGSDVRLNVYDQVNNSSVLPAPYLLTYRMEQEYNQLANTVAFTSLILTSTALATRTEWISRQTVVGSGGNQISDNSFKILADFEVLLENGLETRRFIHFLPTAEYRRISLESDDPIIVIDLQMFWKDQYDNLYELMIPAHNIATVKLLFEKK